MDRTSWSQAQRPPQVCAAWAHGRASSSVCAAGPAAACPRAGLTGEVEILVTCGDERGREGGLALVTPSETPASPSQGTNAYRWTDGRNVAVADTLKPRPWPSPRWEVTLSQGPSWAPGPGLPLPQEPENREPHHRTAGHRSRGAVSSPADQPALPPQR